MFVPDPMHELELGVWKSVFSQLIRLLNAIDSKLITELNTRYAFSLVLPFSSTYVALVSVQVS
jgi:hypothetical protein